MIIMADSFDEDDDIWFLMEEERNRKEQGEDKKENESSGFVWLIFAVIVIAIGFIFFR